MSEEPRLTSEDLARLFPAAYTPRTTGLRNRPQGFKSDTDHTGRSTRGALKILSTRARMVLSLELRGKDKREIAQHLQMSEQQVGNITRTQRYIAHREVLLGEADQDFLNMKPQAMAALRRGFSSGDEGIALRASETWMRAAGFMQYGKSGSQSTVTAEDVAAQLLQVNVQVNVNTPGKE